ncbi:ABC transporter ATP-binding protein [Clostridium sp. JN-9]|uniref:ABC transporter ATP-binding protein n=1 Tax=Clostridium sp. JN-9 TaxID=2507159 RepID=UPI000FFE0FB9|nr:ABC transporter ATP-binding protein [Clostridium sp. JN-9]QAT39682.1 ABC transporter ATP-binding protein [Clostridium sp. JN-9]
MDLIKNKILDTDFENIDCKAGQEKREKADMAVSSNSSATEAIIVLGVELSSNIIGFILYSGIISTIHPAVVVFMILSSVINYFTGRYISNYEYENKDNLAPIERKLKYIIDKTGDFSSNKDIRLYHMYPWFKEMFNIFKRKGIYFQKKNIYHRYFANFIDGLLILLRDGIIYGFLIYSVIYKNMSIGNFVLYFGAVAGFSTWLSGIVKNLNSLNSMSLDICDLREFLDMKDNMNRGKGVKLPNSYELPCNIELKNLYYRYDGAEEYTIKNININIKKGEKIALVGVNGAGKSTLVKLICGLYTPSKGEIYINGKISSSYNRDEYYTLFSVVFQDIHLLPVSIEKNIALQPKENIHKDKMIRVLNMSGFMKKIQSLPQGMETPLIKSMNEGAAELSGGETQKLILARALYKDAPIIILDEPTAALDPIAENELYEKYNELTKDHTSIFISHRLSSTRFCDRILFIENGQIIEQGDHQSLMKLNGKYKEMYDMQSYYYKDKVGGEKYA